MNQDFDSTDRTAGDYVMFALGFIGFITAAAGVVLSVTALAAVGLAFLLVAVYSFRVSRPRSPHGE